MDGTEVARGYGELENSVADLNNGCANVSTENSLNQSTSTNLSTENPVQISFDIQFGDFNDSKVYLGSVQRRHIYLLIIHLIIFM